MLGGNSRTQTQTEKWLEPQIWLFLNYSLLLRYLNYNLFVISLYLWCVNPSWQGLKTQRGSLHSPFIVSLTTVESWLPCVLLARQKNWPPTEDTNTGWYSTSVSSSSITSNQTNSSTVGLAVLLQVRVKLVPLSTSVEGLTDTDVFLGPSVGGGTPSQKWKRF